VCRYAHTCTAGVAPQVAESRGFSRVDVFCDLAFELLAFTGVNDAVLKMVHCTSHARPTMGVVAWATVDRPLD